MNRRERRAAARAQGQGVPRGSGSASSDSKLREAMACHQAGRLSEAETLYRQILQANPSQPIALHLLGVTALQAGKNEIAFDLIARALAIKPDYVEAHGNLGIALRNLGELDEAVTSYRKAIAIKPDYVEAHSNLGNALHELGKMDEAFSSHRRAVALNPQNDRLWAGLAASLETQSFTSLDDGLLQDLLRLIERPTVRPSLLNRPIVSALRHQPDFARILERTASGNSKIGTAFADAAERLSAIPLFSRIMALSFIGDLEIERMLAVLRRAMLEETVAGKTDEKSLPFSTALALQCFANEYIYSETDEEMAAVEQLQQQIVALVEQDREVPPSFVATLGAYRPLHGFSWAQELSERAWPDSVKEVIERQISEPRREQSLRSQIPQLTAIQNTISQAVREQYEENPYPRWIKTDISDQGRAIGAVLREPPLRFDLGDYESPEVPEILVAGCGTGQQALTTASRFSNARVLALDLSLASLSYASRKTEELGLSNIEYAQADIMDLASFGRRFDLIECIGVLHHLGDPLAGWRLLVDLLRPGALMMIGLYSETARQDVIVGRSLIAEKGYTASPADIRRCRRDIVAMAENGNSTMAGLCNVRDFFSLSQCRDLLFHVQEHRFTLPRIEAALQAFGLEFLGFEMRDNAAMTEFKKSHPNKRALTSLSLWHKFELENPATFRGMYQFWCKKK